MRLYSSEQEVENYVEQLSLEQIKEMLEFNIYSEQLFLKLLSEYLKRINLIDSCGIQENLKQ